MTVSNALPIQFWDEEDETFNDKEVCSVEPICFCQPFNCSDEIIIQFLDITYSAYNLLVYDSLGVILKTVPFIEASSGLWWLSFIPDNDTPGICEKVILKISPEYDLPYETFQGSLSPWTNVDSGFENYTWTYVAEAAQVTIDNLGSNNPRRSKYLTATWNTFVGITYQIRLIFDITTPGSGFNVDLKLYFSNGSSRDQAFTYNLTQTSQGTYTVTGSFVAQHNYSKIEVYLLGAGNADTWFTFRLRSIEVGNDVVDILKKSDCIELKDSHTCSTLITYSNSKTFAGIDYPDQSPAPEFSIRIPAIFFEEAFPDEHEEIDLSDSQSVRLMNKEKRQKKLDIGFMPFYMHKKLKLILAHDDITIDGDSWMRTEAYEIADGNKRYPLRKASVLLTDKNYIVRNVL